MTNEDDRKVVDLFRKEVSDRDMPPSLKGGGGGGISGGMEARLTSLEADVRGLRIDMMRELSAIRTDLGELTGKVSQLPTTLQLLGFIVAVVVASGLTRHFFP